MVPSSSITHAFSRPIWEEASGQVDAHSLFPEVYDFSTLKLMALNLLRLRFRSKVLCCMLFFKHPLLLGIVSLLHTSLHLFQIVLYSHFVMCSKFSSRCPLIPPPCTTGLVLNPRTASSNFLAWFFYFYLANFTSWLMQSLMKLGCCTET